MLTRFKTNVAKYPRLWNLYMVGVVLAVIEYVFAGRYPNLVYALTAVLAVLIYLWITRSASRTAILLNVLDAFEGREAYCSTCDFEETTEEEDGYEENPEQNA